MDNQQIARIDRYTALTKELNSVAKSEGSINLKGRDGETQVYSI